MTLAIVFKGPEVWFLAADSRVTLTMLAVPPAGRWHPSPPVAVQATYDNATKLLKVKGHDYVATVTFGLGAIGGNQPRTAHSFLPELETEMANQPRMYVQDFAQRLGDFFYQQYTLSMPAGSTDVMSFFVAGYNENEAYGRTYKIQIPPQSSGALTPIEQQANQFGISWGGQTQITTRLLNGHDPGLIEHIKNRFTIPEPDMVQTIQAAQVGLKTPYQFLPLQDCVDLSILLVRTTSQLMRYMVESRGVGGAIDVATVTRNEGFSYVQTKQVRGESDMQDEIICSAGTQDWLAALRASHATIISATDDYNDDIISVRPAEDDGGFGGVVHSPDLDCGLGALTYGFTEPAASSFSQFL